MYKKLHLFTKAPEDITTSLKNLKKNHAHYWEERGRAMAMDVYRWATADVPAYKKFLSDWHIRPESIHSIKDFPKLPILDKSNYLLPSNYADLFPKKDFSNITTISATSGSTGESFYFPRSEAQDAQYEYIAELFLRNQFEIHTHKTLGVIGFGLGIWIGGIFTYKTFNKIAAKGYSLSLLPVGPNIDACLKAVKKFAPFYDQIILMGYPPLVKDIIDGGEQYGVNWHKYRIRILMAAEGFSEKFRDYLARKAGLKNALTDTINMYGTVELGTMAHETALTNFIRTIAVEREDVFRAIFPLAYRLPTLAQYHPEIVYFEEVDGEIVGTGYGSEIPLVRYRFPDRGGVIMFDEMIAKLKGAGIDIMNEAKKAKISETIFKLPFVYVYERSDLALILRGANIYPEEIKYALQHGSFENAVTGKFTMAKTEDEQLNAYFEINVELKQGVPPSESLAREIEERVVETLRKRNMEYNDQYQSRPEMMRPRVRLWPYQDVKYFQSGSKQLWTKKTPLILE